MPEQRFVNSIAIADLCTIHGFGMRAEAVPLPSTADDLAMRYVFIGMSFDQAASSHDEESMGIVHALTILTADVVAAYMRQNRHAQFTWLDCQGALVEMVLARYRLRVGRPYPMSSVSWFEAVIKELDRGWLAETVDELKVLQWLYNSCASIHRHVYAPTHAARISDVLLEAEHYLRTHYQESLSVARLAEFANLSVRHFARKFTRAFARAPIEELLATRVQNARVLLQHAELSINEVAGSVGFDSAAYFTKTFKAYYGETPGTVRKACANHAGRHVPAVMSFPHAVDALLREGWQLVHEQELSDVAAIVRNWSCLTYAGNVQIPVTHVQEYYAVEHGVLELFPYQEEVMLRWNTEIDEEVKVDLVVENDRRDGINLTLAISGDTEHGYRLRLSGYAHQALESIGRGHWEVFATTTTALDPRAPRYHLSFWRSDNTFHVEINGKSVLEYYDPLAPTGALHRMVSLGRAYFTGGSTRVSQLRLYRRVSPKYVDILDRARTMLHYRQYQEAHAWCLRVLSDHSQEVAIRQEAQYLAAIALPRAAGKEKITFLAQIVADRFSPLRLRCLRELIFLLLEDGQIPASVARARELAHASPGDETLLQLAQRLLNAVRRQPPAVIDETVSLIATLPLSSLTLDSLTISSLKPITAMSLQRFTVIDCPISDLAPLSEMPLSDLRLSSINIDDLTPLQGQALNVFICRHMHVHSLSPLLGMPLKELVCDDNAIDDLAPLRGMPLELLSIADNQLADLNALRELPLRNLFCDRNHIEDLTPLWNMSLNTLHCDDNRLRDISPLTRSPLHELYCEGNAIEDLSPLCALPLHTVHCGANPLTDLSPLRELALADIGICGIPFSARNLEVLFALPLRNLTASVCEPRLAMLLEGHPTLVSCNEHTIAHLRALLPTLQRALQVWAARPVTRAENDCVLRSFAQRAGDVAYLSLPLRMSWEEAQAFCAWQGGTLACPATTEECEHIYAYLAEITTQIPQQPFHLGLQCDAAQRTFRWQSGAPKGDVILSAVASRKLLAGQGYPYLRVDTATYQSSTQYMIDVSPRPAKLLIQWAQSSGIAPAVFHGRAAAAKSSLRTGGAYRQYRRGEPLQQAMALLREYLREHPAAPAREVLRYAAIHGVSECTLNRARKRLGIIAEKQAIHNGGWVWRLPDPG